MSDLFGDVSEGFVEKIESLLLDFLESFSRLLGCFSGILEVLFGRFETSLDTIKAIDSSHIGI